jgi:GT2 family glycosyltransferase
MTQDELIRRLRRLKMRLASRGAVARALIPFVEVCEFWLSHGFREVILRSRMRLNGQTTPPAPPTSYVRRASEELFPHPTIPAAGSQLRTSIVIPVLNNGALTYRCLQSVVAETRPGTYEVIIIDNGSDEPTQEMLSGVQGLRVIRNQTNVGFVGACNQGAAAARGEFVLFLNNDTLVVRGWLDQLLKTFERDPTIGAVGGKLIYPNGRLQEAGGIIWDDGEGWAYGHNEDPELPEYGYVREVDYCSGACLMVPSELFRRLGGFDNRYAPAYYEDVDLAFRLREHGYRVAYQPAARVIHFEGATAGTDTSSGLKRYQLINHKKFIARHAAALTAQHPHDPALLRRARDRRRGKRILVMDHMVPHHDQDAGSVRMMALLQILVDLGYLVTFLPDNLAALEPYTTGLQQLGIEVLYGPSEFHFVERNGDQFDIAILCRARFAASYLPQFFALERRPRIIFDTIDLHYLREQRFATLKNDPSLMKAAERTRDAEIGVMRMSDMVWVTSTHEAELLKADATLPALGIVPMIHHVREYVPPFGPRRDILFVGSFRHPPNEDAVVFFLSEIMPLIRPALPGVRFLVVGSHVPPRIQKLASADVVILGFVPDLAPLLYECRVSVAPLRYGSGVKGKLTQSLAWGLPAVATPIAAEGLRLVDGDDLLIASDPVQFAQHVIRLYQEEALWTHLSHNGRNHIATHLSYETVRTSVATLLDQVLNDPLPNNRRYSQHA